MIYHFDTEDVHAATAALVLYAAWRSRDTRRFKIKPDVWDRVTRFVKASAKRAVTIPRFLDALMPKLLAGSLRPKAMAVGYHGLTALPDGCFMQNSEQREFMTGVLESADHRSVLDKLYHETVWIVLLVRDRLEREKPFEEQLAIDEESL